ncbi:hypothetical protein DXG01_001653 [Tephrocybe rancida]|nr:hypothetical protein DXG01_001653 [Tephrocybe rancida]
MGTTSSKPTPASKPRRRSNAAQKNYNGYNQPLPPNYWPTAANYGYEYPAAPQPYHDYAPVIPQPPVTQYPASHYSQPHSAPVIPMPQPQPYVHPQHAAWPAIHAPVQPTTQPAAQQQSEPVIPPAPRRDKPKKRKTTRTKRLPTATISFEPPDKDRFPEFARSEPSSAPADLSRRVSNVAPSQQGHSTPHPPSHHTPASSPSRSPHARRASTQSSTHAYQPSNSIVPLPSHERRPNPLPKVPDDVFATTPYRHLLEPITLPPIAGLGPGFVKQVQPEVPQKAKKGLFGLKKKSNSVPPIQRATYTYTLHDHNPMSARSNNPPPTSASTTGHPPPTFPAPSEGGDPVFPQQSPPPTAQSFLQGQSSESSHSEPGPEPIYFNQDTDFAPLLNHSPYSVSYERIKYPTATHLLEALKFLPEADHNRGIAEKIRTCEDTAGVYRLARDHVEAQNEDNGEDYMKTMENVMYLKFYQHADLREILLSSGEAPLIYDDPSDSFWGIGEANGEPGHNELGHLMERVRLRLQHDMRR